MNAPKRTASFEEGSFRPPVIPGHALEQSSPALFNPWILALIWVIPQTILFKINLGEWSLISGKLDAPPSNPALFIFSAQILSWLAGLALYAWLWWQKTPLSRPFGAIPLALGTLFLAVYMAGINEAIPSSAWWKSSRPNTLLTQQFLYVTPAALLGALRLLHRDGAFIVENSFSRSLLATLSFFCLSFFSFSLAVFLIGMIFIALFMMGLLFNIVSLESLPAIGTVVTALIVSSACWLFLVFGNLAVASAITMFTNFSVRRRAEEFGFRQD